MCLNDNDCYVLHNFSLNASLARIYGVINEFPHKLKKSKANDEYIWFRLAVSDLEPKTRGKEEMRSKRKTSTRVTEEENKSFPYSA